MKYSEREAAILRLQSQATSQDEVETESELQRKIVRWAKDHGYPVHEHPRSQHHVKAHGASDWGWADVTVVADGRVLFIELKAKTGATRGAQKDMERRIRFLGGEYYKIKTWKAFMEVVG